MAEETESVVLDSFERSWERRPKESQRRLELSTEGESGEGEDTAVEEDLGLSQLDSDFLLS